MRPVISERSKVEIRIESNQAAARRPYRRAAFLAVAAVASAGLLASARASGISLWLDQNGSASGFGSGNVSWDTNITNDWNIDGSAGNTTAPGKWLQAGQTAGVDDFNIANFNAAFTVTVNGTIDIGGINFNSGASTIQSTAALNGALSIGANNITIFNQIGGTGTINVPINGSGDITVTSSAANNTLNFGAMTGFTGNLIIAAGTDPT